MAEETERLLKAIEGYAEAARSASDPCERKHAALALLRVALTSTGRLHELWDTAPGPRQEETAGCLRKVAPLLPFWPVPFNEVADLTSYKTLRIGYEAVPSKDPTRRAGDTVFAKYAVLLVRRIAQLRAEAIRQSGRGDGIREDLLRLAVFASEHDLAGDESSPWREISRFEPSNLNAISALPEFSTESAKAWAKVAERAFRGVYTRCELIPELAAAVRNPDLSYPSQQRAQITHRIGRAVVSIAPRLKSKQNSLDVTPPDLQV